MSCLCLNFGSCLMLVRVRLVCLNYYLMFVRRVVSYLFYFLFFIYIYFIIGVVDGPGSKL